MPAVPGSVLEQARKARKQLAKPKVIDIDLPGYENILRVRYGALSWEKTLEFQGQRESQGDTADTQLFIAAEILMECCKCFLVKVDDQWVEWEENGEPVRYDATLVKSLGIELPANPQPRDIVYGVFGGLGGDSDSAATQRRLMGHELELMITMDNEAAVADDELVGKSGNGQLSSSPLPESN